MAKGRGKDGVPNKHLHARISYLQQAATYLTVQGQGHTTKGSLDTTDVDMPAQTVEETIDGSATPAPHAFNTKATTLRKTGLSLPPSGGLPLYLTTHLKQVALKSQIRLHPNIKRQACKVCSTVLIEGETCTKRIENLSRGGRKAHADVMLVECGICGAAKRFPVGAKRQRRKGERAKPVGERDSLDALAHAGPEAKGTDVAIDEAPR